jgi:hypothetical protein
MALKQPTCPDVDWQGWDRSPPTKSRQPEAASFSAAEPDPAQLALSAAPGVGPHELVDGANHHLGSIDERAVIGVWHSEELRGARTESRDPHDERAMRPQRSRDERAWIHV